MSLSLRQIRYFIATAEAGQLSLAASTLGVSQSAVTEAIKSLERETGARLFRRGLDQHARLVFLYGGLERPDDVQPTASRQVLSRLGRYRLGERICVRGGNLPGCHDENHDRCGPSAQRHE